MAHAVLGWQRALGCLALSVAAACSGGSTGGAGGGGGADAGDAALGGAAGGSGTGGAGATGGAAGSGAASGAGGGASGGGAGTGGAGGGSGTGGGSASGGTGGGGSGGGGSGGGGTGGGGTGGGAGALAHCEPLPAPPVDAVIVDTVQGLRDAIQAATPGTTIVIEDGTYAISSTIVISNKAQLTIRGRPGHAEQVILQGPGAAGVSTSCSPEQEGFQLFDTTDLVISDLTLIDHRCHAIQVNSGNTGLRVHRTRLLDSGQQVFKVNPGSPYNDDGVIECSLVGMTTSIQPPGNTYSQAIDIHAGARWLVRDNVVENMVTSTGALPVSAAIACWNGCFDTVVERNVLVNCAMGITLGPNFAAGPPASGRHGNYHQVGGVIRNNFVGPAAVQDFGIAVGRADGVFVYHNTVWHPGYAGAVEVFPLAGGAVTVMNNLVNALPVRDRTSGDGSIFASSNGQASASWFVDAAAGDLHLTAAATGAIDEAGTLASPGVWDDVDGEPRPGGGDDDLGADER
ncbi:MAG: hypothetical protein IT376_21625 [Polyangiaceae bacterium]|nr:hypothetical protein [Polyangiaceae bacterium]